MNHRCSSFAMVFALLGAVCCVSNLHADPGQPVAVKHLAAGGFAVESMWNLSVAIHPRQYVSSEISGVDVLLTGVDTPPSTSAHRHVHVMPENGKLDLLLDRRANDADVTVTPYNDDLTASSNAMRIRGSQSTVTIGVDGLTIVYLYLADPTAIDEQLREVRQQADVLLLSSGGETRVLVEKAKALRNSLDTSVLVVGAGPDEAGAGNTLAVSDASPAVSANRLVVLSSKPLTLPAEMNTLWERKEAACQASQEVFAKLSVAQMNFRPSNGTHTPRWNAEHMMGRELLFFSQIFHALDPAIPVIDLNPAQMPPDYQARHPDWTGKEEARQMQRVSAFTRRFAYLMRDLPLNDAAPASRWTPAGLLRQMERHYDEHTANVKEKFKLDDWPEE